MWYLTLFVTFLNVFAFQEESWLVNTTQGPVRGFNDPEEEIFVFYNIPYATAPTGVHRFKAPLPPPEWEEPYEALNNGITCPQEHVNLLPETNLVEEDCLVASIYVPMGRKEKLPVVVIVHGGGFVMGFGDMISPKKIVASGKIIAVTFNYRLGAHGFLCLGTEDAPGNAGMKDQVALLRWVQKNIANFGGNPDDITVSGFSAGSAAAEYLMLSKMADGLFNKVIAESASSTAAFSIQTDPVKNALEYAKLLKFKGSTADLEDVYKSLTIEELNSIDTSGRQDSTFLWAPCVEVKTSEEQFLTIGPVDIIKSGNYKKLPFLYGFSNMEGASRASLFEKWKDQMNKKFSDFLPPDLEFKSDEGKEEVANEIKQFYFGIEDIDRKKIIKFVQLFGDIKFTYPILRAIKLHVKAGHDKIYMYEYSFVDENTPTIPHTKVRGADHCSQTIAVLDNEYLVSGNKTQEFIKMISTMRTIWLDFMTTGNPVPEGSVLPEWLPVGDDWTPYMSLNNTIKLSSSLKKKRFHFWEEVYDKYYKSPLPPILTLSKHEEL